MSDMVETVARAICPYTPTCEKCKERARAAIDAVCRFTVEERYEMARMIAKIRDQK